MSVNRDGRQELKVSGAVTSMDKENLVMVSPEKPRPLETTDLCRDTLSSLSLGNEVDLNKVSENNTSESEWSDTSQESEEVIRKRRLSREETYHQEMKVSKKARTESIPVGSLTDNYNYLMCWIREKYLPEIPRLRMFGFEFKVPFKLELEDKSNYPKLVEALHRGVPNDGEADDTDVNQSTEKGNNECIDHSEITHCSKSDKLKTNENICSIMTSATNIEKHESDKNIESKTNRERTETDEKGTCIRNSDINEADLSCKSIINKGTNDQNVRSIAKCNLQKTEPNKNKEHIIDAKSNIAKQTFDSSTDEEIKQPDKTVNRSNLDRKCYNIVKNDQYSDISEDEGYTLVRDTPILNLSIKGQTERVAGCHTDTPPPGFYHPEVNFNIQAKGKTTYNPNKGKQMKKRSCKKRGTNAKPSVCAEIPPEIDKSVSTHSVPANSINRLKPLLQEKEQVQGPLNNENFRQSFASVMCNYPYQIKEELFQQPLTNENKEVDMTKLPKLSDIEVQRPLNEQNSPTRQKADHEEVKQKLNKKIVLKMQSEGKFALEKHADVLRIDEQIKTEVPDPEFDRAPAIEEDPDATLLYGFDGPGGRIV